MEKKRTEKKTGREKEDCTKTSEANEAEGEEERRKVQSRGKRKGQRKHLLQKAITHALRTRAEFRAAIDARGVFTPSMEGMFEGAKTQERILYRQHEQYDTDQDKPYDERYPIAAFGILRPKVNIQQSPQATPHHDNRDDSCKINKRGEQCHAVQLLFLGRC